jgi:catechol 2,3-dioxygenase-like lactoylglutathione lyase family enzyme
MTEKSVASIRYGRIAPCLEVRDIEAAYRFYSGVLGFEKSLKTARPLALWC